MSRPGAEVELALSQGDTARISLHGAQVLGWRTANGAQRLYLSENAVLDGTAPIRGGIPLCFPQFNLQVLEGRELPKHGFVRNWPWQLVSSKTTESQAQAVLSLADSEASRALWPARFAATVTIDLTPATLQVTFSVVNTGAQAWRFALALHTYLAVDDIVQTQLTGLQGLNYWDAVQAPAAPSYHQRQSETSLAFSAETDRVYRDVTLPTELRHPGGGLQLTQSASLPDLVVWNPAAERCGQIADLPANGWQHLLCVEAACIHSPVRLEPSQRFEGWQRLVAAD